MSATDLVSTLLEEERRTGRRIPRHPFELSVFIREGVGRHITEAQQVAVYTALTEHFSQAAVGGGAHAVAADAATMGERRGDDATNNQQHPHHPPPTSSSPAANRHSITRERLEEHDRLIPPAGPLGATAEEASIPLIGVLDATARKIGESQSTTDGGGNTNKNFASSTGVGVASPARAPSTVASVNSNPPATAVAVTAQATVATSAPSKVRTIRVAKTACAPSPMEVGGAEIADHQLLLTDGGGNTDSPRRVVVGGGGTVGGLAITNLTNAAINPLAAIANTRAVASHMSSVSHATAITAASLEEEVAQAQATLAIATTATTTTGGEGEAAANDIGFLTVSEGDYARIGTVCAYILVEEDVRCPDLKAKLDAANASAATSQQQQQEGSGVPTAASPTTTSTTTSNGPSSSLSLIRKSLTTTASLASDKNSKDKKDSDASFAATRRLLSQAFPLAIPYCPVMDRRRRFVVEANPLSSLDTQRDPFYMYEHAEGMVELSNSCTASWVEASEWFERAARAFASIGLFRMAANCQVRQYDCLKATGRLDDAGQALVVASHYYTHEGLADDSSSHREANEAALAAMQNAIALYDDAGRDVTAAKLCTEAAELCVRAKNPGLGVDILHVSAASFEQCGQLSYAERCYARAAEIAILDMSDFPEAIDTLEKMAKVTPLSRQPMAYFKAFIVRFVCVPPEQGINFVIAMEDCAKTLSIYEEHCPQLVGSPSEYNLIRTIMSTQKKFEDTVLEEAISKYLLGAKLGLEQWAELVLRKIHENLLQRKLSVEKLYSL